MKNKILGAGMIMAAGAACWIFKSTFIEMMQDALAGGTNLFAILFTALLGAGITIFNSPSKSFKNEILEDEDNPQE